MFVDEMLLYVEKPKESTKVVRINVSNKIVGHKIDIKILLCFLPNTNKQSEN